MLDVLAGPNLSSLSDLHNVIFVTLFPLSADHLPGMSLPLLAHSDECLRHFPFVDSDPSVVDTSQIFEFRDHHLANLGVAPSQIVLAVVQNSEILHVFEQIC